MSNLDYDHTTTGTIDPIDDHVIVVDMENEGERVVNGIILPSEQGSERGIRARWAQVYAVGPNQKDIKAGEWVLVEHGRWTRGVKLSDQRVYRKVDNNCIFGVCDQKPTDV